MYPYKLPGIRKLFGKSFHVSNKTYPKNRLKANF